jgi:hypothetical protein
VSFYRHALDPHIFLLYHSERYNTSGTVFHWYYIRLAYYTMQWYVGSPHTSHTLIVSETPAEGEESSPPQQNVGATTPPSSPLVPSPKRTRVETIPEPTLQLGSSSNSLLDDVSSWFSCHYLYFLCLLFHAFIFFPYRRFLSLFFFDSL